MSIQAIERVHALDAKEHPLESGIKIKLHDVATLKEVVVDYDEVRDAE